MLDKEQILDNMTFILKKDELTRVRVKTREGEPPCIVLDVHEWGRVKTKNVLDRIILLNRDSFGISLIHGYNRGTVLKKMILKEYHNSRIMGKRSYGENPGITFIRVAPPYTEKQKAVPGGKSHGRGK